MSGLIKVEAEVADFVLGVLGEEFHRSLPGAVGAVTFRALADSWHPQSLAYHHIDVKGKISLDTLFCLLLG